MGARGIDWATLFRRDLPAQTDWARDKARQDIQQGQAIQMQRATKRRLLLTPARFSRPASGANCRASRRWRHTLCRYVALAGCTYLSAGCSAGPCPCRCDELALGVDHSAA